jgi:hypothetical protein
MDIVISAWAINVGACAGKITPSAAITSMHSPGQANGAVML